LLILAPVSLFPERRLDKCFLCVARLLDMAKLVVDYL